MNFSVMISATSKQQEGVSLNSNIANIFQDHRHKDDKRVQ